MMSGDTVLAAVVRATAIGGGGALVVLWLAIAALLHRSGPIRLRHWAEEAGERLRNLYDEGSRFEAYRLLASLLAVLSPIALLWGLRATYPALSVWVAAGIVVGIVALGELWNRWLVLRSAEDALRWLTPVFRFGELLLRPLAALLAPLLPDRREVEDPTDDDDEVSDQEIDAFLDVGRREGILEPEEEELVRGLMELSDTQVRSIMTPRVDIVSAAGDSEVEAIVELAIESGHSRLPLYDGSIDQVVGILHIRDLMRLMRGDQRSLLEIAKPPHFVPETKAIGELLRELQARHQELAIVVDEYGGTCGLVTLEDILEEIVGEIVDEHDEDEEELEQLADGSWRVRGTTHVEELEDLFGVRVDGIDYETVGGLIFGELGHVPSEGDRAQAFGLTFVVERVAGRRIESVCISAAAPPAAVQETAE